MKVNKQKTIESRVRAHQMKTSNLIDFIATLGISPSENNLNFVKDIIHSSHHFYRSFKIPKRKGGLREISVPFQTLHYIQSIIKDKILLDLPIHKNAFSYMKKRSAIDHARHHCCSQELLMLDIKDFFPSISKQDVFNILSTSKTSDINANYLSHLCTLNNSLPQGACTSPVLSNAIMFKIDCRLDKLAEAFDLKYSRYSDDLAFSGKKIPKKLIKITQAILKENDFDINPDKTKLKLEGTKKIITGVSISSGELKAPKVFKRELRARVYELEKFQHDLFKTTNFDPLIYEKTIGKLNYLLQIEPENNYAIKKRALLIASYKQLIL